MITRYRVALDGTYLDQYLQSDSRFKDKIVTLNIQHSAPEFSRTIETPGDIDGGIITKTYRQKVSVTITFGIYVYDIAARNEACQKIKTLCANVSTVVVNDRKGQALFNCVCEQYPEIDSAKDWTEPLTMTFSRYAFPYWQESADPIPKALTGTNTNLKVTIPGNAPKANCKVEIIANENFGSSGAHLAGSTVDITVGNTMLYIMYEFKKNNYCLIDNDSYNNLRIRIYDNSSSSKKLIASGIDLIMPKSDDKLIAIPGQSNKFGIRANKKITAKLYVRGAWL